MPPETLEEEFARITGKQAKLLEQIGNELVETEIYNPEFVEWLKVEWLKQKIIEVKNYT